MEGFNTFWNSLSRTARLGLATAALLLTVGTLVVGWWLTRADYQVLFADLAARDSASMVAELDKLKVPYRLEDGGNTILVPADQVHRTRLKLVSKDLPLQGAIGFELFNNNDVGMTDFAQKVNYQRALQGELTRTILALDEVQAARVHLALPEQGPFRKSGAVAKASVAITLKPGRTLSREQVRGVQRLVAAAIPDIKAEDVTVLDQRGVALTPDGAAQGETAAGLPGTGGFEGKRDLEDYLGRQVLAVLDQTFGPGQSIARVDVVLNHDHARVTTESVLPSNAANGYPAGVIVREHETASRDGDGAAASATAGAPGEHSGRGLKSREVQYQVGRRVEQVVTGPGAISKLNVVVIVKKPLDAKQTERLKDVVATAVGLNRLRGDGIAVYTMDQLAGGEAPATVAAALPAAVPPVPAKVDDGSNTLAKGKGGQSGHLQEGLWAALGLVVVVGGLLLLAWRSSRRPALPAARRLSGPERQQLLGDVQRWLDAKPVTTAGETTR